MTAAQEEVLPKSWALLKIRPASWLKLTEIVDWKQSTETLSFFHDLQVKNYISWLPTEFIVGLYYPCLFMTKIKDIDRQH